LCSKASAAAAGSRKRSRSSASRHKKPQDEDGDDGDEEETDDDDEDEDSSSSSSPRPAKQSRLGVMFESDDADYYEGHEPEIIDEDPFMSVSQTDMLHLEWVSTTPVAVIQQQEPEQQQPPAPLLAVKPEPVPIMEPPSTPVQPIRTKIENMAATQHGSPEQNLQNSGSTSSGAGSSQEVQLPNFNESVQNYAAWINKGL
jgi:hypothetical protein